jgi:flagellar biosynthesis chaperone FliJ
MTPFTFDKKLTPIFKKMLLHLISQKTEVNEEGRKALQVELASLKKKLENVEERFVNGEIDQTLYLKFRDKYRTNILQIESELDNSQNQLSNLEKAVDKCLKIAIQLPSLWGKLNFGFMALLYY